MLGEVEVGSVITDSVFFNRKTQLVFSLVALCVGSFTATLKLVTQFHFLCKG